MPERASDPPLTVTVRGPLVTQVAEPPYAPGATLLKGCPGVRLVCVPHFHAR